MVHTWLYCTEPCFTGFRGALCDANTLVPDVQQSPADQDIDWGGPCQEDEDFIFLGRGRMPLPWKRRLARSLWMAWRHRHMVASRTSTEFLGRLPVPAVNASQAMTHKDVLEGCFLKSVTDVLVCTCCTGTALNVLV
jgi:hypothetical protein